MCGWFVVGLWLVCGWLVVGLWRWRSGDGRCVKWEVWRREVCEMGGGGGGGVLATGVV